MKKLLIGLALGIVLGGLACYLTIPGIKQTAYDSGFDAGNKKGIATGTAAGITEGISEAHAQEMHTRDSLAQVEKNKEAAIQRAALKPRKVVKEIQNWHVIGGKIEEPILDTAQKIKPGAKK